MTRGRYNFRTGLEEEVIKISGFPLDNGGDVNVFTVLGGPVQITSFIMVVTEAVSANAATIVVSTNNDGTVVYADGLDVASAQLRDVFYSEGDGTALVKAAAGGTSPQGSSPGVIILPDGVDIILSTTDPTSGIADIYIRYIPLFPGATITE